ncbi:hypothetical protein L195_g054344 [Trifolium pratense]|uniref:Uncharacterized protein n=1 Tax=Trifolium pratense TaxID=57577 RepID=A0A2K3KFN2_TRIPR|nr:hypothetical protein L195_g054344 [Trifolium pratense]
MQHATTNYDNRSSHDESAPATGTFKHNINAAIFKEHSCYGGGMCLRDKGNFIRAQTLWWYGSPFAYEAEAWGH